MTLKAVLKKIAESGAFTMQDFIKKWGNVDLSNAKTFLNTTEPLAAIRKDPEDPSAWEDMTPDSAEEHLEKYIGTLESNERNHQARNKMSMAAKKRQKSLRYAKKETRPLRIEAAFVLGGARKAKSANTRDRIEQHRDIIEQLKARGDRGNPGREVASMRG